MGYPSSDFCVVCDNNLSEICRDCSDGEVSRLRGALQNVMMMLNHNESPDKTVKWIENVLSLDLSKDDVDGDDFYTFKGKA